MIRLAVAVAVAVGTLYVVFRCWEELAERAADQQRLADPFPDLYDNPELWKVDQ